MERRRNISINGSLMIVQLLAIAVRVAHGYINHPASIVPGMGLISPRTKAEIVIFEHTIMGTGGLVYNCPTPLSMGQLPIPKFQHFKDLPLMLGCGINQESYQDGCDVESNEASSKDAFSSIPLGEVSPWFWLHDLPNIPGSYELEGACGKLYMGGNIEKVAEVLQTKGLDYKGHVKFFREYKIWQSGELEEELSKGKWIISQQDPCKALQPIMFASKL